MKDLVKLVEECKNELDALQIPYDKYATYSINTRAKHRWGQCRIVKGQPCEISISYRLMEESVPDQETKTTILHEMLHSCEGGAGHTGLWKQYATLVNRTYGYRIKRNSTPEERNIAPIEIKVSYKYIFECKGCGAKIYRQRESRFTKRYRYYCCAKCGGKFIKL